MNRAIRYTLLLLLLLVAASCHKTEEYANNPRGNFEALWTILDEHYCFFEDKGVDWQEVRSRYAAKIGKEMTREELFIVCSDMLGELRDGHVNLSAPFATSYYREWWSLYPQDFSMRLIEESYFNFNYRQTSGMLYGLLPENVGYLYIPSFATPIGEGNLDHVLNYLSSASGLVIDIRDNGGGALTEVETLVARFIDRPTTVGYISHKTGPGHNDFSSPRAIVYKPAPSGRVRWGKPVVLLVNRSTYSAANNFASIMKNLDGVLVAGAMTGGGSGVPYSSEIPCGWSVRFSACPMLDSKGVSTEGGVAPSEGCEVHLDPVDALAGHDTMLDRAIQLLTH